MHLHFLFGAILHATVLAVIGFFVLFAAGKANGIVRAVGMLLGWWLWLLAVAAVVCAVLCPTMGGKDMPWMDHMGMHGPAAAAPADTMAPAKPDATPARATPATPPKKT